MSPTNPLGNLFGKSPFPALQEHMRVVLDCAREVPALLEALSEGDHGRISEIRDRVDRDEAKADLIKNQIRSALPRSLFMPVDRRDLLDVLHMQDSIADTAQDIAGLLVERRMELPGFMRDPILLLARRCIDACEQSARIIEELDELLETGFRGREASRVEAMTEELGLIEDDTDELGIQLARVLFEHEDELKPVSVMMWYRLIEWIGDLADYAEKVGDRLRLLIAR